MRIFVFLAVVCSCFLIGCVYLSWAGISYLSAHKVVETRCQNVKHEILPGNHVFEGFVIVCWDLIGVDEYPPKEDGPVTWCKGINVITSLSPNDLINDLMNELRANYPITSPPTYYKCYHSTSNYRRMFTYVPDRVLWRNRFDIGLFFVFCATIAITCYYLCDSFMKKESQKPKTE